MLKTCNEEHMKGTLMDSKDYDRLVRLAEFWESIADRLDNQPVVMTANSHRLFANNLRAVLAQIPRETLWERLKTKLRVSK